MLSTFLTRHPDPGFTVRPNVQYVFHLGGNIPDPHDELGRRIRNVTVVGLRAPLAC